MATAKPNHLDNTNAQILVHLGSMLMVNLRNTRNSDADKVPYTPLHCSFPAGFGAAVNLYIGGVSTPQALSDARAHVLLQGRPSSPSMCIFFLDPSICLFIHAHTH
jgi:hypothetical protein